MALDKILMLFLLFGFFYCPLLNSLFWVPVPVAWMIDK